MFNPILTKEEFPKVNLFKPRPSGEPGIALVLYRDNGVSLALQPGHSLTAGDIAWGKYKGFYRVDVAEHSYEFQVNLPCEKDAFNFDAKINVTYRVTEPATVVDKQIKDPESILKSHIVESMRSISRKYTTQQSEDAERKINMSFSRGLLISGITITKIVSDLSLDSAARDHLRKLQEIDNDKILQSKEHELNIMKDQFDIERQKIKMDFYGPLLQQGQWQMLALHLARNPDDVATVAQLVNQQRKLEFDNQIQTLKALLDGDVIEGFQVEGIAKQVLQRLVDNLGVSENKNLLGIESSQKQLTDSSEQKKG